MTASKDDAANLTGAYALNALTPTEREQVEAYLEANPDARYEVTELSDTAVLLGLAAEPVTPPPALKASIMAQLSSTPQLSRIESDEPSRRAAPSKRVEPDEAPAAMTTPAEYKARQRWFTRPVTALAAAAAAVALIVGGGVVANTITTNNFEQAQASQLAAIEAAPDSQRISAPIVSGGTATLVWSGELASSALVVEGLDPLPATHVYELWYIDGSGARPAGTFTVDSSGNTWRVLEGTMAEGDTVGVTVEPRGGSPKPTTDPVVAVATA